MAELNTFYCKMLLLNAKGLMTYVVACNSASKNEKNYIYIRIQLHENP